MPRRGHPNIGRSTRQTQDVHRYRATLTPEQQSQNQASTRTQVAQSRAEESQEQRTQRLTSQQSASRLARRRVTDANRNLNRQTNTARRQILRELRVSSFNRFAFQYDPEINYGVHAKIAIGEMNNECRYCHALKFKHETPGMCCASGKVRLPMLNPPPEPLKSLMSGADEESKLFLRKIRKFNSCFQMTSFAANIVSNTDVQGRNFDSTFKIQGQVYHHIGSLLPMPNETPKFLQIYFMGDEEEQVNVRCQHNHIERFQERAIVSTLETFLAERNQYIQVFKRVAPQMQNDNYSIVIKADKVPIGEHVRRFNAPVVNEVGIVMVGDAFEKRDVQIRRRDNTIHVIQDTHRSYDALQYPLIFGEGENGYHIDIPKNNPATGQETNKTVSSMNFYAYRIMNRVNEENHILKCHLYHQYIVDMYAKVESERKSFLDLIVKHKIFGETQCHMYSIEWQKRGLPHAHILVWMVNKIRPEEIDQVISAEIPDRDIDPELFEIVKTNMVHGPCGSINMNSPCMDNGKCSKRFPREFLTETITGIDGYPLYRRRSPENGGHSFMVDILLPEV